MPAATAALSPLPGTALAGRQVVACTLLPSLWPAIVRADGTVWLAVQVQHSSGDASRDLAHALELATEVEPGEPVAVPDLPGPGPRLQDLLVREAPLEVSVHSSFDFWLEGVEDPTGQLAASMAQANSAATPTARLGGVEAAYWSASGTKEHLRWVMPHDEDDLLDALARLHAAGEDDLGPTTRLIGSFRAGGLLVPVWEMSAGTGPVPLEELAAAFLRRLDEALEDPSELSREERSARAGLATRQVTIR